MGSTALHTIYLLVYKPIRYLDTPLTFDDRLAFDYGSPRCIYVQQHSRGRVRIPTGGKCVDPHEPASASNRRFEGQQIRFNAEADG